MSKKSLSQWKSATFRHAIVKEVNDLVVLSHNLSQVVVLPWRFKASCHSTIIALAGLVLAMDSKHLSFETLLCNENDQSGIFYVLANRLIPTTVIRMIVNLR